MNESATGFDPRNPPFDRLSAQEIEAVRAAIDIGYFPPGQVIVASGQPSDLLHVIIKGAVEVRLEGALEAVLGPKDSFDSRALVHGAAGEDFVAAEETLCFLVPRELVRRLIAQNLGFAAFFYSEISDKLAAFARTHREDGVESVLRARVRDASRGRAVFIPGDASIADAGQRMQEADINALFVEDGEGRTGVVTGMNLAKATVLKRLPLETKVREISHFDVIAVDADDFLYDALLLMTRHDKRRLAVRDGGAFAGFLEDIDILGLVAGNSQLIPGRIDRARGTEELAVAAREIQAQVERLHRQGVKVEVIAEITSDLNRRLFIRSFELLAPPSVREHGCLLVMGSEGRGEQTVRTDQDNGLILARDVPETELAMFREQFSGALDQYGFPPCPGNVMVRNPLWSQPIGGMVRQLRHWVTERTPEAAMNLAIFFDAVAVTGRTALLEEAKQALVDLMRGEQALLARFANLIETFATPTLGVLSTFMASVGVAEDTIDIKKAGIFPIVHGMRTMAMDRGILATATADRIAALVDAGAFEPDFGRELISALRVFMEYRLRSQLEAVARGDVSREALVRPAGLSAADRDILRDALRIVRRFRETFRHRYRLGSF